MKMFSAEYSDHFTVKEVESSSPKEKCVVIKKDHESKAKEGIDSVYISLEFNDFSAWLSRTEPSLVTMVTSELDKELILCRNQQPYIPLHLK
jgi:hypothetical protein